MRRFQEDIFKVWDLDGGRASEVAGIVATSPVTGVPVDTISGRLSPWAMLPVDNTADETTWFQPGRVVERATRFHGVVGFEVPFRASGRSSYTVETDGETMDIGPDSHLFRVVDGHFCLLGNDPAERSDADRADLPGGGFLAWLGIGAAKRTRLGDALAPMRFGLPTGGSPGGSPGGGSGGGSGEGLERPFSGLPGPDDYDPPELRPVSVGGRPAGNEAITQFESRYVSLRELLDELNRLMNDPNSTKQQVREAEERVELARQGYRFVRPDEGIEQIGPGRYRDSSGRILHYDLTLQRLVVAGSEREMDSVPFAHAEQFFTSNGQNRSYIQLGLGYRPYSSPFGVIIDRPREATPEERARIERRIAVLQERRARVGLTAEEAAELSELIAIRSGKTRKLTLGLPGGGSFTDARGRIVQSVGGREYISIFGNSRTLGASITGTVPRTPQEWGFFVQSYREDAQRTRDRIRELERARAAAEAGIPPTNPELVGAPPQQLEYRIQQEKNHLAFVEDTLNDIRNGTIFTDRETRFKNAEEREAEQGRQMLANRPLETGLLLGTLFGDYDGYGYPLAFNKPLVEDAHGLYAHGHRWALGHFIEWGGFWRPVVPIDYSVPEELSQLPPQPPERKRRHKPVDVLPPAGKRGKRRADDVDEIPPCSEPVEDDGHEGTEDTKPGTRSRDDFDADGQTVADSGGSVPREQSRRRLPFAGRSLVQPTSLKGVFDASDVRARLGGGPWHPEASLVPRGGIAVVDPWEIGAHVHTTWDVHNLTLNRLNQVISLVNDRFPFGQNTLDEAGLYMRPHETEEPRVHGAFQGTVAFTRIHNGRENDGLVQGWIRDDDGWQRWSADHLPLRTLGRDDRRGDVLVEFATGLRERRGRRPRFGWEHRLRGIAFRNARAVFANGLSVASETTGAEARIDASAVTETRTLSLQDADGTIALTSDVDSVSSGLAEHLADFANPHAVTKAQVGLGNVVDALQLAAENNLADLTDASMARSNLGLVIGEDVQPYDADLTVIAGLPKAARHVIIGNSDASAWEARALAEEDLPDLSGTYVTQADLEAAFGDFLRKDGTVELTADWDAGNFKIEAGTLAVKTAGLLDLGGDIYTEGSINAKTGRAFGINAGGASTGTGNGADVILKAGTGGVVSGKGGSVRITSGDAGAPDGESGDVHISTSDTAGAGDAGRIFLTVGQSLLSGYGQIYFGRTSDPSAGMLYDGVSNTFVLSGVFDPGTISSTGVLKQKRMTELAASSYAAEQGELIVIINAPRLEVEI